MQYSVFTQISMKCKYTKKFYEFVKSENYKVIKANLSPFDEFREFYRLLLLLLLRWNSRLKNPFKPVSW